MSFHRFLVHLILYCTIIQLDGTMAKGKVTRTHSSSTASLATKASSVFPTPVGNAKPSPPSTKACSAKRTRGITCTVQENIPWYLQWISLKDVNTFPWKSRENYYKEMTDMDWNFKWTIDLDWGGNVIVYVLDSGVTSGHTAFKKGQVEAGESLSKFKGKLWESAHQDTNGHGTEVASLIVGQHNGVAHKGHIYPIKIIHGNIPGTVDEMTEGILLAVENWKKRSKNDKELRAVINLSVEPTHTAKGQAALELAIEAGMHVVMSAGNDGIDGCYDTPRVTDDQRLLKTVGQIYVSGIAPMLIDGKFKETFHELNYGSCIDIFAPSEALFAATIGGNEDLYTEQSGSSFAAALVSGVIASLLSSHPEFRNLKPAAFKTKFLEEFIRKGIHDFPPGTPDRSLAITQIFG